MRIVSRIFLIAFVIGLLAACGKQADTGKAVAMVNGVPVTEDLLHSYVRSRTGGRDVPLNDEQRQAVLNTVIDMEVLAQAAEKSGLADKPDVAADLRVGHDSLLAQQLIRQYIKDHPITEDQIKAAYEERLKSTDKHEYKARHILVASEQQADDIIVQLNKGANFAKLAQKYSKDSSAAQGGDLGDWFSPAQMVPEFSAALATLKKGEYTHKPVHTQYGWHVIQLEDVRDVPAPSLDQMRGDINNDLQSKLVEGYINQLRGTAKVQNLSSPDTAKSTEKAPAAATASGS